jgi:molybdate transport system ATP-binding protein
MIALDLRYECGAFELSCAFETKARVLALHGASGAGKSTLANLIAGQLRPREGRIAVAGETLVDTARGLFLAPEKRRIGFVFQDALLFPHMKVRANILFGHFFAPKSERRVAIEPVVETLGVAALLERWPATLSGGERQRVGLARALLASPRLLLMDEPMAALDYPRRQEIMGLIERLRDEFAIPIVLASHSAEEIMRLADDVVVLDKGRVAAHGAPAQTLPGASRLIEGGRFALTSSLAARVGEYDTRYGVTRLAHPSGEIVIAARIAPSGGTIRISVKATDVALARTRPLDTSVRTILHGKIATIDATDSPLAFVTLELTGGAPLTAAVTRLALDELGLAAGAEVFALVKSVALDERGL